MRLRSLWTVATFAIVLFAFSPGIPGPRAAIAATSLGTPAILAQADLSGEYLVIQTDAPLALYRGAIIED